MPHLMIVNPSKRRRSSARKTRKVGTTRRRRARRSNPLAVSAVKRRIRRASPVRARGRRIGARRRRRNPISMRSLSSGGIMKMLTNAAVGGAGAVSMDIVMAQLARFLPASLQPTATPGLYDAVKAGVTVVLGRGLSKMTKGLSERMAMGALTVQAANLISPMVAKVMPQTAAVAGLGYAVPTRVIPGVARIGPISRGGFSAYSQGKTPLLNMYSRPGSPTPLLSGARRREGQMR